MASQEDCFFFFNSNCTKGDDCAFRHERGAVGASVCEQRENRSSEINPHLPHETLESRPWETAAGKSNEPMFRETPRSSIPCYYENQPSGCLNFSCNYLHHKSRPFQTSYQFGTQSRNSRPSHPPRLNTPFPPRFPPHMQQFRGPPRYRMDFSPRMMQRMPHQQRFRPTDIRPEFFPNPPREQVPGMNIRDVPGRNVGDVPRPNTRDVLGRNIGNVPGQNTRDVLGRNIGDVPRPNIGDRDVPGQNVGDRPRPNTRDVLRRNIGDVPRPNIGDRVVPGQNVGDVPRPNTRDVLRRNIGDVPRPNIGDRDVPGQNVGDVPRPNTRDVLGRNIGDVPRPNIGDRDVPGQNVGDVPRPNIGDVHIVRPQLFQEDSGMAGEKQFEPRLPSLLKTILTRTPVNSGYEQVMPRDDRTMSNLNPTVIVCNDGPGLLGEPPIIPFRYGGVFPFNISELVAKKPKERLPSDVKHSSRRTVKKFDKRHGKSTKTLKHREEKRTVQDIERKKKEKRNSNKESRGTTNKHRKVKKSISERREDSTYAVKDEETDFQEIDKGVSDEANLTFGVKTLEEILRDKALKKLRERQQMKEQASSGGGENSGTVVTPAVETPAVETPAVETPAVETPAVETPAVETSAVETPTVETPVEIAATLTNNVDNITNNTLSSQRKPRRIPPLRAMPKEKHLEGDETSVVENPGEELSFGGINAGVGKSEERSIRDIDCKFSRVKVKSLDEIRHGKLTKREHTKTPDRSTLKSTVCDEIRHGKLTKREQTKTPDTSTLKSTVCGEIKHGKLTNREQTKTPDTSTLKSTVCDEIKHGKLTKREQTKTPDVSTLKSGAIDVKKNSCRKLKPLKPLRNTGRGRKLGTTGGNQGRSGSAGSTSNVTSDEDQKRPLPPIARITDVPKSTLYTETLAERHSKRKLNPPTALKQTVTPSKVRRLASRFTGSVMRKIESGDVDGNPIKEIEVSTFVESKQKVTEYSNVERRVTPSVGGSTSNVTSDEDQKKALPAMASTTDVRKTLVERLAKRKLNPQAALIQTVTPSKVRRLASSLKSGFAGSVIKKTLRDVKSNNVDGNPVKEIEEIKVSSSLKSNDDKITEYSNVQRRLAPLVVRKIPRTKDVTITTVSKKCLERENAKDNLDGATKTSKVVQEKKLAKTTARPMKKIKIKRLGLARAKIGNEDEGKTGISPSALAWKINGNRKKLAKVNEDVVPSPRPKSAKLIRLNTNDGISHENTVKEDQNTAIADRQMSTNTTDAPCTTDVPSTTNFPCTTDAACTTVNNDSKSCDIVASKDVNSCALDKTKSDYCLEKKSQVSELLNTPKSVMESTGNEDPSKTIKDRVLSEMSSLKSSLDQLVKEVSADIKEEEDDLLDEELEKAIAELSPAETDDEDDISSADDLLLEIEEMMNS